MFPIQKKSKTSIQNTSCNAATGKSTQCKSQNLLQKYITTVKPRSKKSSSKRNSYNTWQEAYFSSGGLCCSQDLLWWSFWISCSFSSPDYGFSLPGSAYLKYNPFRPRQYWLTVLGEKAQRCSHEKHKASAGLPMPYHTAPQCGRHHDWSKLLPDIQKNLLMQPPKLHPSILWSLMLSFPAHPDIQLTGTQHKWLWGGIPVTITLEEKFLQNCGRQLSWSALLQNAVILWRLRCQHARQHIILKHKTVPAWKPYHLFK